MAGLPVTLREAKAFEVATSVCAEMKGRKLEVVGASVSIFDKAGSRRMVVEMVKRIGLSHPSEMVALLQEARGGWDIADQAARELILEITDRHDRLPVALAGYQMEIVSWAAFKPKRGRGQPKTDFALRDVAIAELVAMLVSSFGLRETGHSSDGGQSACAVVRQALMSGANLNLSYKAVETIWLNYKDRVQRSGWKIWEK